MRRRRHRFERSSNRSRPAPRSRRTRRRRRAAGLRRRVRRRVQQRCNPLDEAADDVIAGVWRALRSGGRFVGEFGGYGCVETIKRALIEALRRRGIDGDALNPWYFPTIEDYSARLARRGFAVRYIALIPRPTPLPTQINGWLETFTQSFMAPLAESERAAFIDEVREALRPDLCDS